MKRVILLLLLMVLICGRSLAQPNTHLLLAGMFTEGGEEYLSVPGPYGEAGQQGWIWQLILDAAQDGPNSPSTLAGSYGLPTVDDFILASGRVGDSLFVPTNPSSIAFPLTYPTGLAENHVYVRIFGADSLQVGTPYVETPFSAIPELLGGFNQPFALPIFSAENGGLMDRRLGTSMHPWVQSASLGLSGAENRTTLNMDNGQTVLDVSVRNGGHGLHWLILEKFSTPLERWEGELPPLDRNIVVLSNLVRDPGDGWSASLTTTFTSDEIASLYGSSVEPADVRFYRETAAGWSEEQGFPVDQGEYWEITLSSHEPPFAGRWTLAPVGNGTSVESESSPPLSFHLYPAYPSPFNPETRIRFDLPQAIFVRMEVYDILGRRVTVLLNRVLPAGSHAVTFSGGHLASGTYFLRLRAGDFHAVQKMVLIR